LIGAGQSKVSDFRNTIFRHKHVSGLYVLMHQTSFMNGMDSPGKLDGNIKLLLQTMEVTICNPVRKRASFTVISKNQRFISYRSEESARKYIRMFG